MKRLTYKIEATENGYTESLSFLGITVSKTWKRTDTGMRCEENDLCEQLEKAGINNEDFLDGIYDYLDESNLGMDLSALLR